MNDSGTTLLTTGQRISSLLSSSHQAFPPIPSSAQDFLSTGVNQRPAFFGCNPSQIPAEYPLIIYIPNSPPLDGSPPASKYVSILSSIFSLTQLDIKYRRPSIHLSFCFHRRIHQPGFPKHPRRLQTQHHLSRPKLGKMSAMCRTRPRPAHAHTAATPLGHVHAVFLTVLL